MHHRIDTERTTRSAALFEHQLSAIRVELDQQRHFRTEQLGRVSRSVGPMSSMIMA
jgi:hypothetical protein